MPSRLALPPRRLVRLWQRAAWALLLPRTLALVAALPMLAAGAAPLRAQLVVHDRETLPLDRPEAWAMAWFASVATPTALGPAGGLPPGGLELSLEGGWVPSLSERERTVGFLGTKPEDLNRTSAFGRLRVGGALGAGFTGTLGWVPPATVGGIRPNLLSATLERALWQGERASLAARLLGESGSFTGDITCPADAATAGADPLRNPYGCEHASDDFMHVRLWGGELRAGTTLERWPAISPYVGLGASRLDATFDVRARYNGLVDRTHLETSGTLWSATLGASIAVRGPWRLAIEGYYAPLDVERPASGRSNDSLLNARVALCWRLR